MSAIASPSSEQTPSMDDMRMLIQRLARSLNKAAPGNDLSSSAMDYLKRVGLVGTPLRGESEHSSASHEGPTLPPMPMTPHTHPKIGPLYDRIAMHLYAVKFADMCVAHALDSEANVYQSSGDNPEYTACMTWYQTRWPNGPDASIAWAAWVECMKRHPVQEPAMLTDEECEQIANIINMDRRTRKVEA